MKATTLEQRFRLALLFVCVLSLLAFGVADRQVPLALAFVLASVSGWIVTERGGGGLPRWLTTVVLSVLILGLLYRAIDRIPPVSLFATFLSVVMILKLWERRVMRDYAQILTIALFMVVGTVLTDPGLATGVLLIILLPVFVWTVMLYQLHNQAANANQPIVQWAGLRRSFHGAALFAMLSGSAMATAAFILVPRGYGLGGALEGSSRLAGRSTGFAEEVRLGQGGIISQSSAPVMEVALSYANAPDTRIGDSSQPRYLRGIILDDYQNGRWTPAHPSGERPQRRDERLGDQLLTFGLLPPARTSVLIQKIRPLVPPRDGSPLFMIYRPFAIKMKPGLHSVEIEYEPSQAWARRPSFDGSGEYTVYSAPEWEPPLVPDGTGHQRVPHSRRGEVSFPSERTAALARRLLVDNNLEPDPALRPNSDDERVLQVLQAHLQRRCQYSLENAPPTLGQDPTDWFLFDARKGHCEYFASALAGLARSVGIDARVVGGYLATEYDDERQVYVVRAWSAHAWVEAAIEGGRWITLDATPPSDFEEFRTRNSGVFLTLARWIDQLEAGWNSSIVTFDQSVQAKLLGLAPRQGSQATASSLGSKLRDTFDFLRTINGSAWLWLGAPLLFFVVGLAAWRVVRRRPGRRSELAGWGMPASAAVLRVQLLSRLSRLGHTQPQWQSLEAFVASAAAQDSRVPADALPLAQHLTRAAMDPSREAESLAAAQREPHLATTPA